MKLGKLTVGGHPLHPILVTAPVALLPFSLVMDLLNLATSRPQYARASYYGMMGALLVGVDAATAGLADYMAIPARTAAKRTANLHAALNAAVIGTNIAYLLRRRRNWQRPDGLSMLASSLGNVLLAVSGWYGGHLVYEHGMRVRGCSPEIEAPELKIPGDETIVHALTQLEERVAPSDGPTYATSQTS